MVAALEREPVIPFFMEETMTARVLLEIAAAALGIALAAWSGPTVHNALSPHIEAICPTCRVGPR